MQRQHSSKRSRAEDPDYSQTGHFRNEGSAEWQGKRKKTRQSIEPRNGARSTQSGTSQNIKSRRKRSFLPKKRFRKLLKLGYSANALKLQDFNPILNNYVSKKYKRPSVKGTKIWGSDSHKKRSRKKNKFQTKAAFKNLKSPERASRSQNKNKRLLYLSENKSPRRNRLISHNSLKNRSKRREISSLTEAKRQTTELKRKRKLKRALSGDFDLRTTQTPKGKISFIKKNKQDIQGVDFLSHRIKNIDTKENLAGLINRTMQFSRNMIRKKSVERRPKLKLFNYQNAVVVRDDFTKKSIILFKTGEVFFGEIDSQNAPQGKGIFFFPYCGYVYGNFDEGRLDGKAILKDPDSSFGFYNFEDGIVQEQGFFFKLNWDKIVDDASSRF